MPLEDVCAVEAFLSCAAAAWTETTHHCTLVVCQSVSVLIVLPGETLDVVFATGNRTLLRSLVLMSEHVGLEIFDVSSARRDGADALVAII